MANANPGPVHAEVMLRDPRPDAGERVAAHLQREGVAVTARGAASLSIRCPQDVFERVFQTRLRPAAGGEPRPGVRDFGPAPGAGFAAEGGLTVPPAIAGDVEGVYLQGPARLH